MTLTDYSEDEMLALDVFCIWYTAAIAVLSLSFLVFACVSILYGGRRSVSLENESRMIKKDFTITNSEHAKSLLRALKRNKKKSQTKFSPYLNALIASKMKAKIEVID